MKTFFEEFKKFIDRGSVLDLAVGVVVGGAFTSIVNSLVNDIVTPIIGSIIGGFDFSNLSIPLSGESSINIGLFIQNVIDFILVALVLFIVVRSSNRVKEKAKLLKKTKEENTKEEIPEDIKLLRSIEKEIKKINKWFILYCESPIS